MSKDLQKTDTNELNTSKKGKLDLLNINTSALTASLNELSIPRLFYQLVVFVLDGSGSMTYPGMTGKSKGEEVNDTVKKVFERLLKSKNKNSFDISVWAYANESIQITKVESVASLDLSQSINPCDYIEKYDGTNLISTIESVKVECEEYLKSKMDKNAQALVLILSDGALDNYNESKSVVAELKQVKNITVSSIFYESKAWQENYQVQNIEILKEDMKFIASTPSLFTSSLDPEEIRKHMIKSISTVSKID